MQMLRSEWGREWEEWAGWFFEGFVVGFCVWLGVWHCTWLCAWLCTWNGGSGSGVVHCWLAFPVEEVCCYLERGGGAGRVLLVVGVPGGRTVGVDVSARIHGPSPQLALAFHLERWSAIE